jgi:hypothetical protein
VADSIGEAIVGLLASSEDLTSEAKELIPKVAALVARLHVRTRALREAPMPYRESTRDLDDWLEAYSEWWHANASEEALG